MSVPAGKSQDQAGAERKRLRFEQLLTLSQRLSDAIAADIAALEQGAFDNLKTTDPEIERLCALYGREVKALKADGTTGAPAALLAGLKQSGARLNALLQQHGILVMAMRQAAEGLVQAVAEDVEKTRSGAAPYRANPAPKGTSPSGAIIYNNVV